jgi:hypothetical protein
LVTVWSVTSTVTGGDETPLTVALYCVLRSGVTVNENDPSAAVVVLATAATSVKGYGLAYSTTDAPAGAADGAAPDSFTGCPPATAEGIAAKLVVDAAAGDWSKAANAPVGTAKNPVMTTAANPLASIGKLYGSRARPRSPAPPHPPILR